MASLIVLPPECDLAIVTGKQASIGERHAMGVTREIAEDLLRSSQRRLGVDHPLCLLKGREALVPGRPGTPLLALPLHTEAFLGRRLPQCRQEQAPKHPAEHPHWQEEAFGTRDPGGAIQRQPACWDETMDVGVMLEGLAPGVQDPEKADLRA